MSKPLFKERTIAFFEVVALTAGGNVRMPHQPWQDALAEMAVGSLDARTHEDAGRQVFGNVYALEGTDRLTLHRVRDATEWLQTVNYDSGQVADLEAAANEGIVDTSVVHFAEFGNLVGMIQGGLSAPSHLTLQSWLNFMNPFNQEIAVVPVRLKAEKERLAEATYASTFELRLGATARGSLEKEYTERAEKGLKVPPLGQWIRSAPIDPELTVTVKVASPRGTKKFADAREKLQKQVEELFPTLPESEDLKSQATLFTGFADEVGPARLTELVEHAMTVKRRVPAVNEKGESIRVQAAFQIIESVIVEHEDQLREATEYIAPSSS